MKHSCKNIGDQLTKLEKLVLAEWENSVRDSITKSRHENSIILQDHFLEIINQLVSILRDGEVDENELGKAHGFQRAILTQYTLKDVLEEYSLLRETLISYLYPIGDIVCVKLIHKYIDILCKHSVIEFISQTKSIRVESEYVGSESNEIDSQPLNTPTAH